MGPTKEVSHGGKNVLGSGVVPGPADVGVVPGQGERVLVVVAGLVEAGREDGLDVCGRPVVSKLDFRTESVAVWSGTVVCSAS